ncbi:hypothetical protein AB4144_25995, partial [Rhizobiaceae sp. 2RAB30]
MTPALFAVQGTSAGGNALRGWGCREHLGEPNQTIDSLFRRILTSDLQRPSFCNRRQRRTIWWRLREDDPRSRLLIAKGCPMFKIHRETNTNTVSMLTQAAAIAIKRSHELLAQTSQM